MADLFSRSYSSVHVHYIPLKGYESCGSTQTVVHQTVKLSSRIRSDADRVQAARAKAWMRFDNKQLSALVSSAFKHLASGREEPFDFARCRERLSIPDSTEEHFSRILGHCLQGKIKEKFGKMGKVMASSLLRHAIREEKSDTNVPLVPASVFSKEVRALCDQAVSKFLDDNVQCAFINPSNGRACVNTKSGHAQGHQDGTGACLRQGSFVSSGFDSHSFTAIVEKSIGELMNKINYSRTLSRLDWRRLAAVSHRENLKLLRESNGFPWAKPGGTQNDFGRDASVCYACFFGRPEYRLPCGHAICIACLEDFDSDQIKAKKPYPGLFTHNSCVICDAAGAAWPYRMHVNPRLGGVRALSLDGGGVRGVVELVVLRELEKRTGLGIPLGRFFDFIIGTSAGGIVSLGIGIQDRTADDCLSRFHEFTRAGFTKKWLNKTRLFRRVGKMIRSSIYSTPELEGALQSAFRPNPAQHVFGLQNPCRVAVTTTANKDLRLIANYNRGDDKRYLRSDDLAIWRAARCTSAAPMFFERAHHAGNECWDGGLKANNPVQHAVTEAKTIWGEDVDFDLLLSVGSGHASVAVKEPTSRFGQSSSWLSSLFRTMLATMDGEMAWEGFSPQPKIRDRAVRLNVELSGTKQPSLDDVSTVSEMQSTAQRYAPHNGGENPFRTSRLSPLAGDVSDDMLLCLAGRLRASLFFFEMDTMATAKGAAIFGGSICCRLTPDEEGFAELMKCTQYFTIAGEQYELPASEKPVAGSVGAPFKMPITFHWEPHSKEPVRIDVHFGEQGKEANRFRFAISGFPVMVTSLEEYGKMHRDLYVEVRSSRGSAGHSLAKSEKTAGVSVAHRRVSGVDGGGGVAFEEEDTATPPRYADVVGSRGVEGY